MTAANEAILTCAEALINIEVLVHVEDLSAHFLRCSSLSQEELLQHVTHRSRFVRHDIRKLIKKNCSGPVIKQL